MEKSPLVVVSFPAVVGAVLLAKRKEMGISQAEIADAVGVNVSTWSRVENGDSALTLEQLALAATALKVKPSSVLEAAELKVDELAEKGVTLGASRAELGKWASMGAIPLTGAALAGALGPVGFLAAGALSAFLYSKKKLDK